MTRVVLHPRLPRKTPAFKKFEQLSVEINRYYWTFKCSLEHTLTSIASVPRVKDLAKEAGMHLDITAKEFIATSEGTERFARNTVIAMSVTAFEAYLTDVISYFLTNNLLPEKNYKISFRPEEIFGKPNIQEIIHLKAIAAKVDDIVSKKYSGRFSAVCKLFSDHKVPAPNLSSEMQEYAIAACEARNCIIHSAGIIDDRAKEGLARVIPDLHIKNILNINEDLMWKFLAALRDSARAIDVPARHRRKKRPKPHTA